MQHFQTSKDCALMMRACADHIPPEQDQHWWE